MKFYRVDLVPIAEDDTRPGDLVITTDESGSCFGQITQRGGIGVWSSGWMDRNAIRRHKAAQKRRKDEQAILEDNHRV